ncbi:MAG: DUF4382 domain-containing protein, partial [Bacteroidales bacterium]|nr:DUF4382 domain-containing protein [Bacteroidales bacterium]
MKNVILSIFTIAALMSITACNEPADTYNDGSETGKLILRITDDPFNISFVESANVLITKIEIRKAGDSEENPFILLSEDTITLDLLTLRNGITEELVNIEIPKGEYDLVRLYVDEASLTITDQPVPFNVKVPGGSQTGIKIFIDPALTIEGGLTSELLLDFDLSKSFVMRGNLKNSHGINGFIFKPSIR